MLPRHREPEAVAAGLEGHGDARDLVSRPHSFIAPAIEQCKESILICLIYLSGWRSMPGTIPATNQLDRLNSTTAINVVSMSRAIKDRLRSFGLRCCGMGASVARFTSAPMDIISSPLAP